MFAIGWCCDVCTEECGVGTSNQLVNILRADVAFMVNRRVLIILEDGAQAKLLVHATNGWTTNFMFLVVEVFVRRNAVFGLVRNWKKRITVRFVSNLYVNQRLAVMCC